MYEDFEEEYEEDDEDWREDRDTGIDKAREARQKYNEQKANKSGSGRRSNNDPTQYNEARDFDNSLKEKNMARSNNPDATSKAGQEAAKKGGEEVAKKAGEEAVKQAGTQAATTATTAGTTAATAGTAAATTGAVAAQAALPVIGWIALAVEAAIALASAYKKWRDKQDKKLEESGINAKAMRKLIALSPILIPFVIVMLILLLLIQSETQEKLEFMNKAVDCFESSIGCNDFMNTGLTIDGKDKKVIKATDLEIADFVVTYVMAENKYYGSNGSSFMSDIMDEIGAASQDVLNEQSLMGQISGQFQQLVDDSIIGDVNYAWNLFKWMKMEKKIFNNIDWYETRAKTGSNVASISKLKEWSKVGLLGSEPNIGFIDTTTTSAWTWGFHDLGDAYLKVPIAGDLTVDEAIEVAEPYIPSWLELYATFISTGDYKLVNAMYDYYVDSSKYDLEITLYQLLTVKKIEKEDGEQYTTYHIDKGDGNGYIEYTQEEYQAFVDEGSTGFFSWLGSSFQDFIDSASELLTTLIEGVKSLLGFYVDVDSNYVAIVTKGNAYKYTIDEEYTIYTEKESETKEAAEKETKNDYRSIEYTTNIRLPNLNNDNIIIDKPNSKVIKKTAKCKIQTVVEIDHVTTTWTNKLKYVNSSLGEYEYNNRYEQVFMDMVEANGYNYTIDDVAIAEEVIEAYYGQEYTMKGYSVDYSALPEGEFGWPVPANKVVSAIFGYSAWYGSDHIGIDVWAVDSKGTPSASLSLKSTIDVVAARNGIVKEVFNGGCRDTNELNDSCGGGYGNYVLVDHGDGYTTMYAHFSPNTIAVRKGQSVTAGQFLGKMGSSGNSNGVHLHYEIRYTDQRLDPLYFYEVETYNYSVPYANKNRNAITMENPYKVKFEIGG